MKLKKKCLSTAFKRPISNDKKNYKNVVPLFFQMSKNKAKDIYSHSKNEESSSLIKNQNHKNDNNSNNKSGVTKNKIYSSTSSLFINFISPISNNYLNNRKKQKESFLNISMKNNNMVLTSINNNNNNNNNNSSVLNSKDKILSYNQHNNNNNNNNNTNLNYFNKKNEKEKNFRYNNKQDNDKCMNYILNLNRKNSKHKKYPITSLNSRKNSIEKNKNNNSLKKNKKNCFKGGVGIKEKSNNNNAVNTNSILNFIKNKNNKNCHTICKVNTNINSNNGTNTKSNKNFFNNINLKYGLNSCFNQYFKNSQIQKNIPNSNNNNIKSKRAINSFSNFICKTKMKSPSINSNSNKKNSAIHTAKVSPRNSLINSNSISSKLLNSNNNNNNSCNKIIKGIFFQQSNVFNQNNKSPPKQNNLINNQNSNSNNNLLYNNYYGCGIENILNNYQTTSNTLYNNYNININNQINNHIIYSNNNSKTKTNKGKSNKKYSQSQQEISQIKRNCKKHITSDICLNNNQNIKFQIISCKTKKKKISSNSNDNHNKNNKHSKNNKHKINNKIINNFLENINKGSTSSSKNKKIQKNNSTNYPLNYINKNKNNKKIANKNLNSKKQLSDDYNINNPKLKSKSTEKLTMQNLKINLSKYDEKNDNNNNLLENNLIHKPKMAMSYNKILSNSSINEKENYDENYYENNPYMKESIKLSNYIKEYYKKNNSYPSTNLNFYKYGRLIGQGAFGKVNLGLNVLTGRVVAIKSFNKKNIITKNNENMKKIMYETNLMQKLNHPNITKILEMFEDEKYILIIMEYINGGNLFSFVKKRRKLSEKISKFLFKQIILGIKHIHSQNIVHRDIKLENILIDLNNNIKICDFGIGRILINPDTELHDKCGTPMYMAPEILLSTKENGYTGFPVDIWSAGIALYIMLSGNLPFNIKDDIENNSQKNCENNDILEDRKKHHKNLNFSIIHKEPKKIEKISEEAQDLLRGLLNKDPKKRLTCDQILNHPWFYNFNGNSNKQHHLFTKAEMIMLSKTYIDYRKANIEELQENFTISNLKNDDIINNKNETAKSLILTPYNTLIPDSEDEEENEVSNSLEDCFNENINLENDILVFCNKVKEFNMFYELNNNNEVDNGMLINSKIDSVSTNTNNLIENSRIVQTESVIYFDDNNLFEYENKPKKKNNFENYDEDDKFFNEEEKEKKIKKILDEIEKMGYTKEYVTNCLNNNILCHATAVYYLMLNYESI